MIINLFIIVHNFSGAKTYVDELTEYLLQKEDIRIYHVLLNSKGFKELTILHKGNITFVHIPQKNRNWDEVLYSKRAAQLVYSQFYYIDNIILHSNLSQHYYFVREAIRLFHCSLVFTLHFFENFYSYMNHFAQDEKEPLIVGDASLKALLQLSDKIICVTHFGKEVLINIYKIPPIKIKLIYNGIGRSDFKHASDIKKLKEKYGLLAKDRIILFAGRLQSSKGVETLIKTFLTIKNRFPSTKLVIVGSGEYDKYKSLAHECIGRIIFTGHLPKSMLLDFYEFSEIGVIPSQYEQCSYVALEMMRSSLPIIISNVPGLNELIVNNVSGLICNTKAHTSIPCALMTDAEDLANKMEFLLKNKKIAKKFAFNGELELNKKFSLENMGDLTYQLYTELFKK